MKRRGAWRRKIEGGELDELEAGARGEGRQEEQDQKSQAARYLPPRPHQFTPR